MSTLNVTQIKNPDAASPALTLNTDGSVDIAISALSGGPLAGFRNAIINGNFDCWQRATSTSTHLAYAADRWGHNIVGSSATASRQAFTLGQTDVPGEPAYFMRHTITSVAGASNRVNLFQRVEGVRTFAGQEVTLSFWAKADAAKNISVEFLQYFGTGGSPSAIVRDISVTKVAIGTSWQRVAVTATMPSIAGKTLGTDEASDFMALNIWFDAGADFNSSTDTLGQQSGAFDIAQVQLEPGPVATVFERRPDAIERTLCERYFLKNTSGFTASQFSGDVTSGQLYQAVTHFPTRMRTTPTITLTSTAQASFSSTPGTVTASSLGFQEQRTAIASGRGAFLSSFEADAEL